MVAATATADPMIGRKFGRLVVCEFHSIGAGKMKKYACQCECGGTAVCYGNNLRRGNSQSCGCLCIDRTREANTTHGMAHSSTWESWVQMIQRCTNGKSEGYPNYGGRGIVVCERWLSFENFHADMGDRPSDRHSIDREKNEGNYEPDNCRWATPKQQARNRRSNRLVDFNGQVKCLAEWAEIYGINQSVVCKRLNRGWNIKRALTTPLQR